MLVIKETTVKDLKQVAICHRSAFPKALSSKMGIGYLKKMFSWYLDSEKAFLFHLEEDGVCIGYCGGMINDGSYKMGSASSMLQYSFKQAILAIMLRPWLLFQPEIRKKYPFVWRNIQLKAGFRKPPEIRSASLPKDKEPVLSLVVIGVHRHRQGAGIGTNLLKEFERRATRYGVHTVQLSVLCTNHHAIHTYHKNGWQILNRNAGSIDMYKKI